MNPLVYILWFVHSFMEFTLSAATYKDIDKFIAFCHSFLFCLDTITMAIIIQT